MLTKRKRNIVGQVVGRWVILGYHHSNRNRHQFYRCRCSCGKEKIVNIANVLHGGSNSCGCLMRELNSERQKRRYRRPDLPDRYYWDIPYCD
jgi:hypothetical protein